MRRLFVLGISVVGLLCGTGSPSDAQEPAALPPTVATGAPAGRMLRVGIAYFPHPDFGRVNFFIGNLPTPVLRTTPAGIELGLATNLPLQLFEYAARVRQVSGISARMDNGQSFIVVRPACDCDVTTARDGKVFSVVLRNRPRNAAKIPPKAAAAANP